MPVLPERGGRRGFIDRGEGVYWRIAKECKFEISYSCPPELIR
jgi:hypothetical protein